MTFISGSSKSVVATGISAAQQFSTYEQRALLEPGGTTYMD